MVAQHKRNYDKAKQIECEEHIHSLASQKAKGRLAREQDRLTQSIDCAREFLESAAALGYSPRSISKQLLLLLDDYGASSLDKAMRVALEKNVPHPNSVRMILQKHREDAQEQPLAIFSLSQDKRVTELVIKPHSLNEYDELNEKTTSEEERHDI